MAGHATSLTSEDKIRLLDAMAGPHGLPPTAARPADLLVVFGCDDPGLASDAAELVKQHAVGHVVFSGGSGKDSGRLAALGIPEAEFLASVAIAAGMPAESILIERKATNGAENAALALRRARSAGVLAAGGTVAALAPAQRARRLYEELRYQAQKFDRTIKVVAGLSSGRSKIDLGTPATITELLRELQGLHTMHASRPQRIARLPDYQAGGRYFDLVQKAEAERRASSGHAS